MLLWKFLKTARNLALKTEVDIVSQVGGTQQVKVS